MVTSDSKVVLEVILPMSNTKIEAVGEKTKGADYYG